MPRRNEDRPDTTAPAGDTPTLSNGPLVFRPADTGATTLPPVRVLIVSEDQFWRARLGSAVRPIATRTEVVASLSGAREWMRGAAEVGGLGVSLLVIDIRLPDGSGVELVDEARRLGMSVLFSAATPTLDDAVAALRAGASDLLVRTTPMRDLTRRVSSAVERAAQSRRQEQRIVRLNRICRRLRTAREHVARQVDSLCTDLVHAYQELADHMNQVSTASEFGGLIRQELDLEALLRTTLEFILAKTGPTNAAVFLPATSGDFSLGAYVNYDCPRDTIDILLDHMANSVAPRLEHLDGIEHLTERTQIDRYLGDDAGWIADSNMIAFSCRQDGECLAIFLLFRDAKMSYAEGAIPQLKTVRDLFAAQLARVIRIHHRHLPKEKWGALGDLDEPRNDDYGLAA